MMRLKERIQTELTNPIHQINTELVVTAETSKRMSFSALVKKLDKMNYYVNYELLGRRFMKQPNRRIGMYCFQEYGDIHQLTHSHILLRIPLEHNTDHVIKLMNEGFNALDDRQDKLFKVYKETADDVIGNAIYSSKNLKDNYKDSEFVVL